MGKSFLLHGDQRQRILQSWIWGQRPPTQATSRGLTVTNNNDGQKVLATVARTLYVFTERYPEAAVLATGSTFARTRLYRIGITSTSPG